MLQVCFARFFKKKDTITQFLQHMAQEEEKQGEKNQAVFSINASSRIYSTDHQKQDVTCIHGRMWKKYATHEMPVTDMKLHTLTLKLHIQIISETPHVWAGRPDRGAICAWDSTAKTLNFPAP